MEESNGLPKLSVIGAGSFCGEPVLIVSLGELFEAFFGKMEPGGLVCREDESFADREDALQAFGGRDDDDILCVDGFAGKMPKGKVGARIVRYVELLALLEQG